MLIHSWGRLLWLITLFRLSESKNSTSLLTYCTLFAIFTAELAKNSALISKTHPVSDIINSIVDTFCVYTI